MLTLSATLALYLQCKTKEANIRHQIRLSWLTTFAVFGKKNVNGQTENCQTSRLEQTGSNIDQRLVSPTGPKVAWSAHKMAWNYKSCTD